MLAIGVRIAYWCNEVAVREGSAAPVVSQSWPDVAVLAQVACDNEPATNITEAADIAIKRDEAVEEVQTLWRSSYLVRPCPMPIHLY